MAYLGDAAGGSNTPLVILTFLQQTGCGSPALREELDSLGRDLTLAGELREDPGELESDGHFCSSIRAELRDVQPQVDLPMNPAPDAGAIRAVAVGLIEVAEQLERSVVAQAAENLAKKLHRAPLHRWKDHLTVEVEWVVQHGLTLGMQQLPQERILVALTLTLVKGVCERAPRLLRHLFTTALQYINPTMAS